MAIRLIALTLFLGISVAPVQADDWSQWRGPNRDGVVNPAELPEEWPPNLERVWQIEVGEGHSSPVLSNGKIFLFSRQGEEEVVSCIDAKDGAVQWKKSYAAPYQMHSAATGHGKGPKATPIVHKNTVITLGISGILSCYNATSGERNWQKTFADEFKNTSPVYGASESPIVSDDLVIVHVGGDSDGALIAADYKTGEVKWQWTGDGPSYASPMIATFAGTKQVVNFSQEHVVGLDFADGALLWKVPFVTPWKVSCMTPVLYENDLILSGYEQGMMRLKVVKSGSSWATEEVWKSPDFGVYMNTPVLFDNLIVTFFDRRKGQYGIVDAASGELLWQGKGRAGENAAFLRAGSQLLSLQDNGRLVVARVGDNGLTPVKEYRVAESPTWTHPLVFDRKMLIKDKTTLALWKLE